MPKSKSEYNKTYYDKKKDSIIAHQREKLFCSSCNVIVERSNWSRHIRTNKHVKLQHFKDEIISATIGCKQCEFG